MILLSTWKEGETCHRESNMEENSNDFSPWHIIVVK
jgi:hypothetical protein